MPAVEQPQGAPEPSLKSCYTAALVCDRQGQILWANPAMHDILGIIITDMPEERRLERIAHQCANDLAHAVGLLSER